MDIFITVTSIVPVYEQIILQVCSGVTSGEVAPGDPLPPIRQLAKDLALTPATVAKAYLLLEQNRIIETGGRRGTFIHPLAKEHVEQFIHDRVVSSTREFIATQLRSGISKEKLAQVFQKTLESV